MSVRAASLARWLLLAPVAAGGCSILTSFSGLSGGAADASVVSDAAADGEVGAEDGSVALDAGDGGFDANPNRPRVWRAVPVTGPNARHSPRMVFDEARSRTVLFGGAHQSETFDDTWEWDGATWSQPNLNAPDPGNRRAVGIVYASDRHVVLLFGGGGGASGNLWEWDGGSGWASRPLTTTTPNGRYSPSFAFDSTRNVALLFGGGHIDGGAVTDDMFDWTPSSGFRALTPPTRPPPHQAGVMVFDVARARVVLFGGQLATGASNETWEYDGSTWLLRTPPLSPPARAAACGAYDSVRKKTIIFGGRTGDGSKSGAFADTWEYDGTTWTQGPNGPPQRRTCAMAFDSARDEIVMFGGTTSRSGRVRTTLGDTWLYE